jgi:hypothetical protein
MQLAFAFMKDHESEWKPTARRSNSLRANSEGSVRKTTSHRGLQEIGRQLRLRESGSRLGRMDAGSIAAPSFLKTLQNQAVNRSTQSRGIGNRSLPFVLGNVGRSPTKESGSL